MKLGFITGIAIGIPVGLVLYKTTKVDKKAEVINIEKGNRKRLTLPLKYGRIH